MQYGLIIQTIVLGPGDMNLHELIAFGVQASIVITLFGFGLDATTEDVLYVFRRPVQLMRSLLAMFVVMPVVAILLARYFDFRYTVEVALVVLAISPVPPLLPRKEGKAGGRASYALGLMVAMALLSIAIIPLAVHLLALYYGKPFSMGPWAVAKVALTMALVPLAAGMLVRAAMPTVARHLEKPAKLAGGLLLLLGALVILAGSMHAIIALVGSGTLAAFLAFVLAGLAVGHLLGGPGRDDRVVLALSTACRHPGLAIAIAVANAPGDREIVPAVLLYLLVSIVVSIPYVRWGSRQKHPARVDPAAR